MICHSKLISVSFPAFSAGREQDNQYGYRNEDVRYALKDSQMERTTFDGLLKSIKYNFIVVWVSLICAHQRTGGCGTEQACALVLLLRTLGPRVFPVQPGATCHSPLSQIFINEGHNLHKYVLPLSGSLLCAGNIEEREILSSNTRGRNC